MLSRENDGPFWALISSVYTRKKKVTVCEGPWHLMDSLSFLGLLAGPGEVSDRSHSQSWELCTIAQAPWQQLRSSMLVQLMVLTVGKVYAGLP